jgi:hypothetical protein
VDRWGETETCSFGWAPVEELLGRYDFEVLCRGNGTAIDGFEFPFFPNHGVLTLWSAPDFRHECENRGAVMNVGADFRCSFVFVDPGSLVVTDDPTAEVPAPLGAEMRDLLLDPDDRRSGRVAGGSGLSTSSGTRPLAWRRLPKR